jgi:hypothetical protein
MANLSGVEAVKALAAVLREKYDIHPELASFLDLSAYTPQHEYDCLLFRECDGGREHRDRSWTSAS